MSVLCVLTVGLLLFADPGLCVEDGHQQQDQQMKNVRDVEDQLKVLNKQVTALLENRREDIEMIGESMRVKLTKSKEFEEVREEMKSLRLELEQLRSGHHSNNGHNRHQNEEKNDRVALKWLSDSVSELKLEVLEVQSALNATVILQNHEQLDSDLSLLQTDVINLNRELEVAKTKNFKYEAEIAAVREELNSVKDHAKATALVCGKTKNQMKALQIEWSQTFNALTSKKGSLPTLDHPSRHQRTLRKHVVDVERTAKHLKRTNEALQTKILKLEEEMQILQNFVRMEDNKSFEFDRINGNEVNEYVKNHRLNEINNEDKDNNLNKRVINKRLNDLELQQRKTSNNIQNVTSQLSNFDKLHRSMLELLENIENIENKVNKNLPMFRKEISKLEVQTSEATSTISALKEDQDNVRSSMKAIASTVSTTKDRFDEDHKKINNLIEDFEVLRTSSDLQTSKLHDHILKTESSTKDVNATKSTITLVQQFQTFEKEYKNIINKLPFDCTSIQGPSGIYLISPGEGEPITAYCNEGWTTIQRRQDGSVNFNRNWNDYSNGFGTATGEFWIGNRHLHALTSENCTKLQINMRDIYGKHWQANYDEFQVGNYDTGFKLTVNKYSGNASDALDYQNRMEFSTVDNDRDISNTHCASNYEGGWWFSHCQHANLNGRYNLGLTWFDNSRNEWIAVASSEMRLKRRNVC
nr:protein scabrous [Onthophagus taurus]